MSELELLSDLELQQLLINDDYRAFTILYGRYSAAVKSFLLKLLKSAALSEDIAQEVFIKIWANRKRLSEIKTFRAYLFIAARNRALDSLKAAFRSDVAMSEIVSNFVSHRSTTEEDLLSKEYLNFLNSVLNSLPERSREIFSLCREQGKSYEEVASILGISRNAVKNHMVYSMKVLRHSVEKELGISLSVLLAIIFRT
ncbi:MAG TPA: RNA polymerase sigma-70 factor [Pedobacter sp.]